VFASVLQVGEQVVETPLTVHCGLHVAVQHSLSLAFAKCQARLMGGTL
jgi:3-deoxy-D-manno-octulosonate 8-phosphate phosphatase KdsC-like HAD superfamily phosphatase